METCDDIGDDVADVDAYKRCCRNCICVDKQEYQASEIHLECEREYRKHEQ